MNSKMLLSVVVSFLIITQSACTTVPPVMEKNFNCWQSLGVNNFGAEKLEQSCKTMKERSISKLSDHKAIKTEYGCYCSLSDGNLTQFSQGVKKAKEHGIGPLEFSNWITTPIAQKGFVKNVTHTYEGARILKELGFTPRLLTSQDVVRAKDYNNEALRNGGQMNYFVYAVENGMCDGRDNESCKVAKIEHEKYKLNKQAFDDKVANEIQHRITAFKLGQSSYVTGYQVCSKDNRMAYIERVEGDRLQLRMIGKAMPGYDYHYSSRNILKQRIGVNYLLFSSNETSFKVVRSNEIVWGEKGSWSRCDYGFR